MCKIKDIHLKANVFEKMFNLRILKLYKSDPEKPSKVDISEGLDILPEELRILQWIDYPLPYVPLSFCAENLVKLEMCNSQLRQLWDGNQVCIPINYFVISLMFLLKCYKLFSYLN